MGNEKIITLTMSKEEYDSLNEKINNYKLLEDRYNIVTKKLLESNNKISKLLDGVDVKYLKIIKTEIVEKVVMRKECEETIYQMLQLMNDFNRTMLVEHTKACIDKFIKSSFFTEVKKSVSFDFMTDEEDDFKTDIKNELNKKHIRKGLEKLKDELKEKNDIIDRYNSNYNSDKLLLDSLQEKARNEAKMYCNLRKILEKEDLELKQKIKIDEDRINGLSNKIEETFKLTTMFTRRIPTKKIIEILKS